MSNGVVVTVNWTIKPEAVDAFVASLGGMFEETRLKEGFRNIRLLRSDTAPNRFTLIEEWDEARNYHEYIAWRTERGDFDGLAAIVTEQPQIGVWDLNPLAAAQA
ncbi:MAG TPA: antibiotic biosynthesis monooxygenase family protein [Caulobacteraceae bacterium]